MKIVRATKKIEKAIDALIDLQQDYADECAAAKIEYEVQITLDRLNGMSAAVGLLWY